MHLRAIMIKISLKTIFSGLLFMLLSTVLKAQLVGDLRSISSFPSSYVSDRRVDIWLRKHSEGPYQVLLMHDGQMLFQADSTWNKQEWGVDECLDSLYQQGSLPTLMVVGIWNIYEERHQNYFPQKPFEALPISTQDSLLALKKNGQDAPLIAASPNSDDYLRFIFEELLPWLEAEYEIKDSSTYMMGSSMGGLISMYAAMEYPNRLQGVACLSTHWPGVWSNANNPIPDVFINYLKTHQAEAAKTRWYFDRGDATLDSLYKPHQDRVDALFESWPLPQGQFRSKAYSGAAHREIDWRARLAEILLFLLGS